MTPKTTRILRITFWVVFLGAAGWTGSHNWRKYDPLHNHPLISAWWLKHNLAQLGSTEPAVAVRAWMELERCFLTRWSSYDLLVFRVKESIWKTEDPRIHFRLQRSGRRFSATTGPGQSECQTVNEALMAILYQEPGWRSPWQGSWRQWWDANWTYFPNRTLQGLPSGPEAPGARK